MRIVESVVANVVADVFGDGFQWHCLDAGSLMKMRGMKWEVGWSFRLVLSDLGLCFASPVSTRSRATVTITVFWSVPQCCTVP